MNKRIFILIVSVLLVAAISIAFVSCDKPSPEEQFYGKYVTYNGCITLYGKKDSVWPGFIRFENGGGWGYDAPEVTPDGDIIWKPAFSPTVENYDPVAQKEITRIIELINRGVVHNADGLYFTDGTAIKYEYRAEKKDGSGETYFWYRSASDNTCSETSAKFAVDIMAYDGVGESMDESYYGAMKILYVRYMFNIEDEDGNIEHYAVGMPLMKEGSYVEV